MRTSTFSAVVKQLSVMLLAAVSISLNMFASTLSRVETFNPAEFSISTSEVAGMQYSVLKLGDLPAAGEPGSPMLLRRYVSLALPLGATNVELKNISYEVADELHVDNPVFPGQEYGVLEDGTLDIRWVRSVKSKEAENDYRPMLEMGKTWEYNVVDYVIPERAKPNIWRVLKLDGTREIDGKEYYVMHCYLNGSEKPYCGVPVGYFREDLNTRQVFFIKDEEYNEDYIFDHPFQDKFDWPEGETELYYFGFPGRFLGDEKSSNERAIDFIANDGAHKGYDYGSWVMAEGLGLIPIEAHCHGDLFGIPVMFSGFQPYMSYLCHIKDGEGNVLLSYDENVTLCGTYCWDSLDSITDDAHEVKVRIAGENIEISGSCALGNILLMNVQGMIVYREYVWDNKVSIPVGSMLRGVYLVKVGDRVHKVTI